MLGALGADANIKSIAARTGHSVKSVRAKIARLDYKVDEIPGTTVYTADTLAELLHVTPRQIRRWRQRGWLGTKDRRITGECVKEFLRAHRDRIAFDSLPRADQVFLIDLGYPSRTRQNSRRMSARSWTVLVGKGSHGGQFAKTTPPRPAPATTRRTPMMTRDQRSAGLLLEIN